MTSNIWQLYNKKSGFTLVELLIVITLIGILASVGGVSYVGSQRNSRDGKRKVDIESFRQALELYKTDNGRYPGCDSGDLGGWCIASEVGISASVPLFSNYLSPLPQDARSRTVNANEAYCYMNVIPGNPNFQNYTILAYLENDNSPEAKASKPMPINNTTNGGIAGSCDDANCTSFTITTGQCSNGGIGQKYNYWFNSL